ncbi:hypothetical protein JCM21714_3419 [Gracilibacillus boraciitolerans JCM 21714]|uniref:Uncharacterized protein n=1 Tax=Gracilibacillus boraciitolerans JCM 21714 TaxID=1298598 RepID=W4VM68_9BACI|nr:hypothetical protein JCM21714_3419 [Gracilibacillus boraciitolerans JCM 21714]
MDYIRINNDLPKLYITQPEFAEPTRTMQSHYQSTATYEKKEENVEPVKEYKVNMEQLRKKKFKRDDFGGKSNLLRFDAIPCAKSEV